VALLNGPMDRPWGPRTLSFRDPFGTTWELASR
jgi:lactoylglutathione lyase